MWHWGMGFGFGWAILGAIIMVIFWVAVIWLIVWAIKRASHHTYSNYPPGTTGPMTPLDIAKERYAKGEITKEQFDEIKKNL
jgi:putative membrane protein